MLLNFVLTINHTTITDMIHYRLMNHSLVRKDESSVGCYKIVVKDDNCLSLYYFHDFDFVNILNQLKSLIELLRSYNLYPYSCLEFKGSGNNAKSLTGEIIKLATLPEKDAEKFCEPAYMVNLSTDICNLSIWYYDESLIHVNNEYNFKNVFSIVNKIDSYYRIQTERVTNLIMLDNL